MANALAVPPQVNRLPGVEATHKRQQCRRNLLELAEESGARHTVVRAATVKRDDGRFRVKLHSNPQHGGKAVSASARLQRKLEGARSLIEAGRIPSGQGSSDQAPKRIASSNAPRAPAGLLKRREAGQGQGRQGLLRNIPVGEQRGNLGKLGEGLLVSEE